MRTKDEHLGFGKGEGYDGPRRGSSMDARGHIMSLDGRGENERTKEGR